MTDEPRIIGYARPPFGFVLICFDIFRWDEPYLSTVLPSYDNGDYDCPVYATSPSEDDPQ